MHYLSNLCLTMRSNYYLYEKTIIHSDSGVHYQWPNWIDRMGEMVSYDQCQRKVVHLIFLPAKAYLEELKMKCSITLIGLG